MTLQRSTIIYVWVTCAAGITGGVLLWMAVNR